MREYIRWSKHSSIGGDGIGFPWSRARAGSGPMAEPFGEGYGCGCASALSHRFRGDGCGDAGLADDVTDDRPIAELAVYVVAADGSL